MKNTKLKMVGIDVSKATLDVCFDGKAVFQYENNKNGFHKIKAKLVTTSFCVMESTSTYCYKLADYLVEQGFKVSIVNPLLIKRFAQMRMSRTKTDKADAKLIRDYAETIGDMPEYEPVSDDMNDLRQLQTVLAQLIKQRTALKNQLEGLKPMPRKCKEAIKAIEKIINYLTKQIKEIETQITQKASSDCPEAYEKAISVVGIGKRTTAMLIGITAGFTRFPEAKKITAYIGVSPRIIQSGSSIRGRSHICKIGMGDVRAALYMCSHTARKHNKPCRELYERLIAKGKAKKVALLAVVNKLIRQVFACVTKNEIFDNNYQILFGN